MKSSLSWLFELRGEIKQRYVLVLLAIGIGLILLVWSILTSGTVPMVPRGILPHPWRVLMSYKELLHDNDLVRNTCLSYALNLGGYLKALLWAIPIGFLIGLIPMFRGMFLQFVNAIRFVPLTAVTSLFLVWYGIGTPMKMNFLAFGIFIYLLPTIIQRINEVEDVYLTTVYTLGATKWQTFVSVYWPAVLSKLSDDIRVLTAISWTYIIVIENIGANGGIGFLMHGPTARQGRVDKMFALLILVMIIGVIQDKFFLFLDRKLFPHKYQLKDAAKGNKNITLFQKIVDYAIAILFYFILATYVMLLAAELFGILGENIKPLTYLFADRVWVIHIVFLFIISNFGYAIFRKDKK
jgi:ABC-type nitrate/sulfonate/bicarbonate transport system permease component